MEDRRRRRLRKNLLDMFFFFIFSACLLIAAFRICNGWYFNCNQGLEQVFGVHRTQQKENYSIYSVIDPDTFYNYMDRTIIGNLYEPEFLARTDTPIRHSYSFTNDPVWVSSGVAVLLSVVRLRQHRVVGGSDCQASEWLKAVKVSMNCEGIFKDTWIRSNKDTAAYGVGWRDYYAKDAVTKDNFNQLFAKKKIKRPVNTAYAWHYRPPNETESLEFVGKMATYDGGGYVMELSLDKKVALTKLRELRNNNWIDSKTRAIFIEFTTYNPNVNLYSFANFVLEKSAFNEWKSSTHVRTTWFHTTGDELTHAVIKYVLMSIVLLCTLFQASGVVRTMVMTYRESGVKGWNYFWLWLDVTIIFNSAFCIGFAFYGDTVRRDKLAQLLHAGEDYINFQTATVLRVYFLYSICFLLVLCFLKLWHLVVPSLRRLYVVGLTLSMTGKLVRGFAIYFSLLLVPYAALSHVAFGSLDDRLTNFWDALKNHIQVAKLTSSMPYNVLVEYNRILGRFYYVIFNFIAYTLSVNLIISMLTEGLQEAQDSAARRSFKHTYVTYLLHELKQLVPRRIFQLHKEFRRARHAHQHAHMASNANPQVGQPRGLPITDSDAAMKYVQINPRRWAMMLEIVRTAYYKLLNDPQTKLFQRMKDITSQILNPRKQRIIAKWDLYLERKVRLMKIAPERERSMTDLTIYFIKSRTGQEFTAKDNKLYDDINLQFNKPKLDKIQRNIDLLNQKLKKLAPTPAPTPTAKLSTIPSSTSRRSVIPRISKRVSYARTASRLKSEGKDEGQGQDQNQGQGDVVNNK